MKLSAKTRYAIRVIFELADSDKPTPIALLSERTGIALRTVENICTVLRNNEITGSVIGAGGGIFLETPLKSISLGDMVRYFDDGVELAVCCGDKSNDCPQQDFCKTRSVWRDISQKIQKELDKFSLESILVQYTAGTFTLSNFK